MKKLQSNFTTIEQSKRLIELGVPDWTADFYYRDRDFKQEPHYILSHYNECVHKEAIRACQITPCWSVGRLIEIYAIAMDSDYIEFDTYANSPCVMNELLEKYENSNKQGFLDFSKLEE